MKKEFKFTIKDKRGYIHAQEIVTFGSKENPWPEDWKESGSAQMTLLNYGEEFLKKHYTVEKSEDLEFDIKEVDTINKIIGGLMESRMTIESGKNPLNNEPWVMDLSDIGNTIGIKIMEAVQRGDGTWEDFMSGLEHGKSLIDGTHDKP